MADRPLRRAWVALPIALLAGCSSGDDGDASAPTTAAPAETTADVESTTTTAAPGGAPVDGADGLGDEYFPGLGGTGFQVEHYDLALDISADGVRLDGVATIEAVASDDLASFTLDLVGLDVASVAVGDTPAEFTRDGRELRIRPAAPLPAGDAFTVVVAYGGEPEPVDNAALGPIGWQTYPGGSYVIGQPEGAANWFPANDHPSDKATFRFELTVPDGVEAVANGVLVERSGPTWVWELDDPMAPYLAQVAVGQLTIVDGVSATGVPIRNVFSDTIPEAARAPFDRQGEMLAFLAERFGPYPFDVYGGLAVDTPLGLALESQTMSLFGTNAIDEIVIVHELAHQWFGDSVGVERWQDIWLNEGFATYTEWLWFEHTGGQPADETARGIAAGIPDSLALPPGDPGADRMFDTSVYVRGALALHAVRLTIGDAAFDDLLRRWATEHAGDTVTTDDFLALAEEVSGQQLDDLFEQWLYTTGLPELPPPAG